MHARITNYISGKKRIARRVLTGAAALVSITLLGSATAGASSYDWGNNNYGMNHSNSSYSPMHTNDYQQQKHRGCDRQKDNRKDYSNNNYSSSNNMYGMSNHGNYGGNNSYGSMSGFMSNRDY